MRPGAWIGSALAATALVLTGCGGASAPTQTSTVPDAAVAVLGAEPYRPDVPNLTTTVYLPADVAAPEQLPVVVLVPGGGWTSADPTGMVPLARTLAGDGVATATTTYRTSSDQAFFPTPVQDVVCAVDAVVARIREVGHEVGPVVVVGHSAGAQLAALAALVGDRYHEGCPSQAVRPDGLVGLAGPYDVEMAASIAQNLFAETPEADPESWTAGNPVRQAGERPDLPVLLVHRGSDTVVPLLFSQDFADALRAGGHPVQLQVLPGLDHQDVYQPDAATDPILRYVKRLQPSPAHSLS